MFDFFTSIPDLIIGFTQLSKKAIITVIIFGLIIGVTATILRPKQVNDNKASTDQKERRITKIAKWLLEKE